MKWYYDENEGVKRYRTIFGYRRRNVFIFAAILLSLIILVIGLAVGLTLKNKNSTYSLH
jgi:hypothetical protein